MYISTHPEIPAFLIIEYRDLAPFCIHRDAKTLRKRKKRCVSPYPYPDYVHNRTYRRNNGVLRFTT